MMETLIDQISAAPFGGELRYWRKLRGITQMELAMKASTTPRHVSFMETGRSRPSGKMVMRLAEALDVPLADRNEMLTATGFEPLYAAAKIDEMDKVSFDFALTHLLRSQEPFPALVLNKWYDVVDLNSAARKFFLDSEDEAPGNVIVRVFQNPGFREHVANWADCAWSMLHDLRREVMATPRDGRLIELLLLAESAVEDIAPTRSANLDVRVNHPVYLIGDATVSTVTTMTSFYKVDPCSADQLRVMSFFPRDPEAERFFVELAG